MVSNLLNLRLIRVRIMFFAKIATYPRKLQDALSLVNGRSTLIAKAKINSTVVRLLTRNNMDLIKPSKNAGSLKGVSPKICSGFHKHSLPFA